MVIVISITCCSTRASDQQFARTPDPAHSIWRPDGSQGDANYREGDCYYSDGTDPVLSWLCTIVFKVPLNTGQFGQGSN